MPADATLRRRLGLLVLVLLWTITWSLSHAYKGIFHDASLYTLQALVRLHPASLAHDVFLSFGSQDRYTLFSPLYAALIRLLGVETAAATLTLTLQLALFASGVILVRKTVPASATALLGASLLLAIPGIYGADAIFTCIEPFVTPRMAAEALVLGSLAAALCERPRLAVALLAPAMLLHPVMAAAGLAALLCLYVGIPRPRLALLVIAAAVILLITASLALPPGGPFGRFDAQWLALIEQRSPYLFLEHWSLDDWSRAAVPLVTLAAGWRVLPTRQVEAPTSGRARKLSQVALLTGMGGLALSLIACDGLRVVLFTQLQPWRWLWLATAVAALLLPAIVAACWNVASSGRSTAMLLAAAWVFPAGTFALVALLAALVSVGLHQRLGRSETRLIFYGACALLAIAITLRIASNTLFVDAFYYDPQIPAWIRKTASFAHDGFAPFAVMLLASLLATRRDGVPALLLLGAVAVVACSALTPNTWAMWSGRQFPAPVVAQFADWRSRIPPGADVFWAESPVPTWVMLERSSYLSVLQTSGMVFSRPAAMEMQRRAKALQAVAPADAFLQFSGAGAGVGPSPQQLEQVCATSDIPFVVTAARLDWPAVSEVSGARWHASGLRLYRCADQPR